MSPRTSEQYQHIRDQSRKLIKNSALVLFSKNGFSSTKVDDIAKHAKVSKGLIYNYFSSKDDLLKEILADATLRGQKVIEKIERLDLSARERLKYLVEYIFDMMQEDFEYWKLVNALSYQEDVLELLSHTIKEYLEKMISIKTQLFKEIGSPDPLIDTYSLSALLDGVFVQYIHLQDNYPMTQMKKHILETYLK
ncbi:TetR/AcrR family transcriptional regulator [Seonamhaeicola sp.]|uniref:TetR/AcrR family transcriptional regulator n=1 Tax=Seonamhaeicola sp. TaxID=1912245 RepID=UPI00262489DA|nr:TetR/AcrR family transcriptional regulator [Seonamhaeicola sp.]